MRTPLLFALLLFSAVSASATPPEERAAARLAKEFSTMIAGEPINCVSASLVNGPRVVDRRTLVYRSGSRVWRNDLARECPGLRDDDIVVVKLFGSSICRNDLISTVDRTSGIPGPQCRLGRFTPYTREKKP